MKKIAAALCLAILLGLVPQAALAGSEAPPEESLPASESLPQDDAEMVDGAGEETTSEENAEAQAALAALVAEQPIMALVYLSDTYAVRAAPAHDSAEVVTVPSGQQVQIQALAYDEYGTAWAKVTLEYADGAYEGYIIRTSLACSDERFLAWEGEYGMQQPRRMARATSSYPDIAQFPESYQASLLTLKSAHPNWTFVKMNTGLDWGTVVREEMVRPRSLVPNSFDAYMRDGQYGTQGWSYASEVALKYYLDPRNWLNEEYIFQFEQLTYNASYHTEGAVQSFLNSTFMKGTVPQDSRTYARLFWEIGQGLGVSPFHLAARVYSEQGVNGTSALISGTYPGYEGLYNYYNISASGSTNQQVVQNGLNKARSMGWTTPASSIAGGANIISANYILKGQDTVYLQKFDVDPTGGLYTHQYMQSIFAPASEAKSIRSLYHGAGALNNTFVFKIPVYNNMPADNCVLPITSFNVSLTLPAGYSGTQVFLDGEEYTASQQGSQLVVNAGGAHATTATMYKYNGAGVPIGMYAWTLHYLNGLYTATAQPELEDLLTYHGFSVRITGNAGIRFKTGISIDLRNRLTSGGVNGFTLRQYGTLVMNNANRGRYPLLLGGEKVSSGQSYGTTSSGSFMDAVYESVDGRYRYTSVLVGLPAAQYKTEFAFRGYISLTKDGRDYVFYGPPVSRSIYTLAQQVLASGQFAAGSDADAFLKKLIQDAG